MAPPIFQDMHSLTPGSPLRIETVLPPSPLSLCPSDFRPPRDNQEQSKLQECWDKSIAKYMDLPDGYQNVHVLMISWQDEIDQLKVRQEVEELASVFKNVFKYDVTELQLGASKSQLQLDSAVTTWAFEHDSPDSLLIAYYAGHGIYDKETKLLEFSPTNEIDNSPRVSWNKAEKTFVETVDADVFVIMDCCYASDLTRSVPEYSRTFEMLAASHVGLTTAQPGDNSFTRCLIKHLRELAVESSHSFFTTRDIVERIQRDRPDEPPAIWRRISCSSRHIRLSKLKPLGERPKRNKELACHARLLHLGFALQNDVFSEKHIEGLTRKLPELFEAAGVPLVDIKWLGCRSVGGRSFRDVADFVLKNRGDLSAISPEQSGKRSADEAGLDTASETDTGRSLRRGPPRLVPEATV